MIEWITDCTAGTDGENMVCETLQQGFDKIDSNNISLSDSQGGYFTEYQTNVSTLMTRFDVIDTSNDIVVDNLNHISFYIFIAIVFSVVYIISRFIYRVIVDVIFGW